MGSGACPHCKRKLSNPHPQTKLITVFFFRSFALLFLFLTYLFLLFIGCCLLYLYKKENEEDKSLQTVHNRLAFRFYCLQFLERTNSRGQTMGNVSSSWDLSSFILNVCLGGASQCPLQLQFRFLWTHCVKSHHIFCSCHFCSGRRYSRYFQPHSFSSSFSSLSSFVLFVFMSLAHLAQQDNLKFYALQMTQSNPSS